MVFYGQQKEVAKEIQIIREKEEVPVYIVQSTGKTVEKNQINTLSYAQQEKVVGYEHSWKVSKSGQYICVGIGNT